MSPSEGKRYGPVHLGYLTAVVALEPGYYLLSGTWSPAVGGPGYRQDAAELYRYFCDALDQALSDTAQAIEPEAQDTDLARIALDLALRSYANQLACARILDILQPPTEKPKRKKEG